MKMWMEMSRRDSRQVACGEMKRWQKLGYEAKICDCEEVVYRVLVRMTLRDVKEFLVGKGK